MYDHDALVDLIKEKALEIGRFTLASGKQSSYYLDCRQVTLSGRGANLIAEGFLDLLNLLSSPFPDVVGGMAIGADPITAAVITVANQRGLHLDGFIVRKEEKAHGRGRSVEGQVCPGQLAMVVEDVITTGGSALEAVDRVEEMGLKVQGVMGVVDRLEGGREALAQRDIDLRTLLTIKDFGIESP